MSRSRRLIRRNVRRLTPAWQIPLRLVQSEDGGRIWRDVEKGLRGSLFPSQEALRRLLLALDLSEAVGRSIACPLRPDQPSGALPIDDAKAGTVIDAEFKFRHVTL